jgi:hypothetical protein
MNDPFHHRRVSVRGITIAAATAAVLIGGAAAAVAADDGGNSTPSGSATSTSPAPAAADGAGSSDDGTVIPPAPRPHLDGTVTSVESGTILITDPEGFTRTIHTSGDTNFGDVISQPITVGERIHAEGSVGSDQTSLAAGTPSVAPTS